MPNRDKKLIVKLTAIIVATIIATSIFSIDLGIIPPLGNVLFPGNGVWNAPGEVPIEERIFRSGLTDEVIVIRDEWGIPHIYASNYPDLTFALGYCHAQDRFFQMDLIRRQVRGKLSEFIGESGISSDKYFLALGLEHWAQKMLEDYVELDESGVLPDPYKGFMDSAYSYVDGVNYYLNTHKNQVPLEYQLLGVQPVEWELLDSFCLEKFFAYTLSFNYNDIYRYITLDALGFENYYELFGEFDPYQFPTIPEYGLTNPTLPQTSSHESLSNSDLTNILSSFIINVNTIKSESELIKKNHDLVGSNNWVVDGTKTTTGKPILCWDPHLSYTIPGIFYETHMISSDRNVNYHGFTVPGAPIPSEGHTEFCAYGTTTWRADVIDWYYFNTDGDSDYVYNGVSTPYTGRDYTINVKDQDPVQFTVNDTVHGPVLNDFIDVFPESLDQPNIVICPKWTGAQITYEPLAYMGWVQAKSIDEFNEASRYFHERPQNLIYADIDGNIAMRCVGKVPIRDDSKNPSWHPGNGAFPYNGSNGEGEWVGYIPFEDAPYSENPEQNYLASANQICIGPEYTKYFFMHPQSDGYRARRINELLSNAPDGSISLETMKQIQTDIISSAAKAFTPFLISAIENYYGDSPSTLISDVLSVLKSWEYDMDKEKSAPSIYRKFIDNFYDFTFDDELVSLNTFLWPRINVFEYYMREEPESHWFNDITTPGIETRDDIIILAFENTIQWLENFYESTDPVDWKWGKIHTVYFPHVSGLSALSIGPFESSGDRHTLNVRGADLRYHNVGRSTAGSAYRMIADLNSMDNSISVIPSGQSGLSNSKHYSDMLEVLYLENEYHSQYFSYTTDNFPIDSIESTIYFLPGNT